MMRLNKIILFSLLLIVLITGIVYASSKILKDGFHVEYYDGGIVKSESNSENGHRTGLYKEYYKNGQLKVIGNYEEGIKEGEFQEYYDNGLLKNIANFKDGQREGLVEEYSEDGTLIKEGEFHKGKVFGFFNTYYPNGQIESKYHYIIDGRHSVQHGPFTNYYESGQIESEGNFNDGQFDGIFRDYDENGKLISKRLYKNSKRIDHNNFLQKN